MIKIFKVLLFIAAILFFSLCLLYTYFFYSGEVRKPSLPGRYLDQQIDFDGFSRSYSIYIPSIVKNTSDLVFVLHGSNRTADDIRAQTAYEFDQLSEKYGFIVVYPNAYERHWNDCRKSAQYLANQLNINDVGFIQRLIDDIGVGNAVTVDKVFVTGFSNGGHMAFKLAMEAPQFITSIAVIGANLPVETNNDCHKSHRAISVALFNATEDPINPYMGGVVKIGSDTSRGHVLSTVQTVSYWLNLAGADSDPVVTTLPELDGDLSTAVSRHEWFGKSDKKVLLYTLHGSGHVIPSRITDFPRIVGRESRDISGPEEIVNFFLRQ